MFLGLFRKRAKLVKVRRKTKAKKSAKAKVRKSAVKRTKARKKTIKPKRRRPAARKVKKGKTVSKRKASLLKEVGRVTHYFPHVKAAVILVTSGTIALGDKIQIKGHTTDFKQKINSIQINNVPIKEAEPGQQIGLLVKSRVRHNDKVYKL